jgi:uncharacterized membrane protein
MIPEEKLDEVPQEAAAGFDMNLLVGYVLAGGVASSVVLLTLGMAWHRLRTGHLVDNYGLGNTNVLQFVLQGTRDVLRGDIRPRMLMSFGIAILLMTPFARVLASTVYFAFEERNLKYTLFTAFVLLTLTYSLLLR